MATQRVGSAVGAQQELNGRAGAMSRRKLKLTKYPSEVSGSLDAVKTLVGAAITYVRECQKPTYGNLSLRNDADLDINAACLSLLVIALSGTRWAGDHEIAVPRDVEQVCIGFAEDKEYRDACLGCLAEGVERALERGR